MKKDEIIEAWGIEMYEKGRKQVSEWKSLNPELICDFEGLPKLRQRTTRIYRKAWKKYKQIIAQGSRLHYLWIPETDKCICAGLVETDQCHYAFKDVIHIPLIHRGQILERLISKHLIPKFLRRKFIRQIPVFTDEELQASVI